ncbi:hypothetical protein MCHI_001691 [Candidatus Magnetoovum chiemensis]|nr:hypothetical protein MCHI_001691 [Candidatus Magnetoovum chiemensis]
MGVQDTSLLKDLDSYLDTLTNYEKKQLKILEKEMRKRCKYKAAWDNESAIDRI